MKEQTMTMTMAELAALEVHPFARLFPLLTGGARERFIADLRKAGKIEVKPVLIERDGKLMLLDGQNRQAFAPEAIDPSSPVRVEIFEGDDAAAFDLVMRANACRRHMDESQRGLAAGRLVLASAKKSANLPKRFTQDEAAQIHNVSPRTVGFALKVLRHGTPEQIAEVEAGDTSVSHQATMISEAAREDRKAAQSQEDEAKRQAALAAAHAEAADASEPDGGTSPADEDDKAIGEALAPDVEAPETSGDPGDDQHPAKTPEPEQKAKPKKTKSAAKTAKQTPKQKAEAEHDKPLIDKARAKAATDAANFAAEWIRARARDKGDFKAVADALRKATEDAPALAVLRHLLLEGMCGNDTDHTKDAA